MTRKGVEIIELNNQKYVPIKHFGSDVLYPLNNTEFVPKAEALLMDLDGTTLDSEGFWIYIIERTVAKLLDNDKFSLEQADIPYVSGYTTVDHLQYCINKYCADKSTEEALDIYHAITQLELNEIQNGRGNVSAFTPKEGLKEFLSEIKANGIKIGLATSGLDYKAIPEIQSVFRQLELGDPLDFYDSIITGGRRKDVREYGTLGEVVAKPHPFIYSELARLGLKVGDSKRVIGLEDSSAGVLSLRLAGFPAIGLNDGNIAQSGYDDLCYAKVNDLREVLKYIL